MAINNMHSESVTSFCRAQLEPTKDMVWMGYCVLQKILQEFLYRHGTCTCYIALTLFLLVN